MSKELVISASPHETRVAILEDGHLCEIYVEREKEFALVGSIYKGRVTRVLPGMQSAFVDIGLDSDAFLYVSDFLENLEDYDSVVATVETKVQKMEQQGGEVFVTPPAPAPPVAAADAPVEPPPVITEPPEVILLEGETRANRTPSSPAAEGGGAGAPPFESPAPGSAPSGSGQRQYENREYRGRSDRGDRDRGRGGFGRDRGRGGRFSRRGGRDDRGPRREWSGPRRDFPPSKYAPPPGSEPESGEAPEPMILPGESLAKYRERPAAPSAASGASAAAAPAMEPVELLDVPSYEAPVAGEAPAAADTTQPLPAAEDVRPETEMAEAPSFESPAPASFESPAPASFEAPAPPPQKGFVRFLREKFLPAAPEAEPASPEPAAFNSPYEAPAPELRSAAPPEAPAEQRDALEPREEPAEGTDYGAYLEERIASAESIDEYAEEAIETEIEGALDEADDAGVEDSIADENGAAEEAHEAAHAELHGEANGEAAAAVSDPGTEGEAPRAARMESDSRARFRQPARRGGPDRGRGPRGRRPFRGRPQRSFRPRQTQQISEVLKAGEEIIVQIAKEPLGKKGARITSHVALPGRYLVYMPTVNHIGVSRKIGSPEERARLRRLLIEWKGTYGGGFIVRTAAGGATDDEVRADVEFLTRTWSEIKQRFETRKSPAILHRDLNLIERILRDHLSGDFTAIWLDNEEEYTKVVEFVGRFQPKLVNRVKLYTKEAPIFEEFGIQQEIDKSLRPKVWLKSGGYIVINHTEALVAIDVNTGKFVGKGSTRLEDTIVKTNLEAVKEIIRQIRLRDLGGIIVVDFIDMEERRNRDQVMRALDEALRHDKAPSKVLPFNEFGLVAITRKRTKQALERVLCQPCPYCTGSGMVKSIPTICYEIQAEARKMAAELDSQSLTLRVHPEIGKALKTRESALIEELEKWVRKSVIIQSDPTLHWEQYDIF